jgi:hypothetical protein
MWHVVKRQRMQGYPFDVVLKAQNDWIPDGYADRVLHTVASAQAVMKNAVDILLQDPGYNALPAPDFRRFKWGANQCFMCRRAGQAQTPFTHQQQQLLLSLVKRTYYGLVGSHGDLVLKLGFSSSILSGSGRAKGFLKANGMTLEGYVDVHPFSRQQHETTRATEISIGPWKCKFGDIHIGGDFLEYCGATAGEEKAIRILIHESTHKFASTNDLVYFDEDDMEPFGNALPRFMQRERRPDRMLHNADSIAMFCLLLSGHMDAATATEVAGFDLTV